MRRLRLDDDEPLARPLTGNKDARGRFAKGNRLGKGNPLALKIREYRDGLALGATPDDLKQIIQKLVKVAKKPDVAAAKVVFERLLGPPVAVDLIERLERIEAILANRQ